MSETEFDYIEQCKEGNPSAFSALYDAYFERIYSFVYFRTFHRETAEDLTSDIFFKALKGISSFDPSKGSFSSWLYRISRNTIIDHYRTSHPAANLEDCWDAGVSPSIEHDVDVSQSIDELKNYLSALAPEQRDIAIMRLWDNLPYEEIGEILGKSPGSCRMIFCRTMKDLRSSMPLSVFLLFILYSQTV